MTTTTPVTIRPVTRDDLTDYGRQELRDGLSGALHDLDGRQWNPAYDALEGEEIQPDAVPAYGALVDEAVDEVLPQALDLLVEAMNRRLPWTWEPER
jgi:hypothetical protein